MKIRINGQYEFCDHSDNCSENGDLSILYEVPKNWMKWDVEKKQKWLDKNENKIFNHFRNSMYVGNCELIAEEMEDRYE